MIELEYFNRSDFEQLIEWIETPAFLLQWGGPAFSFPLTNGQLEHYLRDANREGSKTFIFKVILKETGKTIGHISLGRIDRTNRTGRIGKVLVGDKDMRGKGIGQVMIKEILTTAFEQIGLHRVSLGVFDFNASAIACYENCGFKKEGLLRDTARLEDTYWSLWEMSMLEDEWEEVKKIRTRG